MLKTLLLHLLLFFFSNASVAGSLLICNCNTWQEVEYLLGEHSLASHEQSKDHKM
ncbi:hypothetical protein F2Q70_00005810 [Brassica cretica]|uniref:Uncharacterized protein n=1 Tax=Brassica cretica TaxID=69181 RepID=A0A8S9IUG9_BRACR|nr:hypothetical protein F2Q70_00005810 [Brassica cretica]